MNRPRNPNYMNSEMAYPNVSHDYTHRGHRDSPIQRTPNDFDVGSTVELASPSAQGVAVHDNLSSMAWAPSPAMDSAMPLADSYYEHVRPMKETWATSVYKGLRNMSTDDVAAIVTTLALSFFIGLAILLLPTINDQWDSNGLDAAADADAGLHLEARGMPPSSPVAEAHKKMPKIDWKITVGTRRPRNSERPLVTTMEVSDVMKASPVIHSNEDGADSHGSTVDGGGDKSEQSKTPWTAAIYAPVTASSERVHIRRGVPYKEHRWTRRSSAKRAKRRQRVRQRAALRQGYVEDEKPMEVRGT